MGIMKVEKIEYYKCSICKKEWLKYKEAEKCFDRHPEIQEIIKLYYRSEYAFPATVFVKFKSGETLAYDVNTIK